MSASSKCPHLSFNANVNVIRLEDTGLKYAELTVRCIHCDAPAVFRGMPIGLSPAQPMMQPDGQEVRLPFICDGDPEPKPSAGFTIRSIQQ